MSRSARRPRGVGVRRGELWTYAPQGSPRRQLAVIVSSDGVNESSRPWLLGAPISTDDPQDILGVPVSGHGWVEAHNLSRYFRPWLREQVGALDGETRDQLDSALQAALDL